MSEIVKAEKWKYIQGYKGLYKVSTKGRIHSCISGKIMKQFVSNGYYMVRLKKEGVNKNKRVARLVAIAFIPNPDNLPEVNHIKGNKALNGVDDIEWSSKEDNFKHSVETGLNKWVKLKEADVVNVKLLLSQGVKTSAIADMYGVTKSCISSVRTRTWKNVQVDGITLTPKYPQPKKEIRPRIEGAVFNRQSARDFIKKLKAA